MTKSAEAGYVPCTPVFLLTLRAACSRPVFTYDRDRARRKLAVSCGCATRDLERSPQRTFAARYPDCGDFIVLRHQGMARSRRSGVRQRGSPARDGTFAAGTHGVPTRD